MFISSLTGVTIKTLLVLFPSSASDHWFTELMAHLLYMTDSSFFLASWSPTVLLKHWLLRHLWELCKLLLTHLLCFCIHVDCYSCLSQLAATSHSLLLVWKPQCMCGERVLKWNFNGRICCTVVGCEPMWWIQTSQTTLDEQKHWDGWTDETSMLRTMDEKNKVWNCHEQTTITLQFIVFVAICTW